MMSLVLLASCSRTPSFDEPLADRSDGALPEVAAARVADGAIVIDGRLDEPAWQRAGSTGMFVSPSTGRPAPKSQVNARARVAWSDERLFVGIVVWDPTPTSPFSRDDVDPHIWAKASGIELMLQPGARSDNRDYFEVQIDVAGAVWDTRFDDYNRPIVGGPDDASKRFGHQEWQSQIERAVRKEPGAGRYVLELGVPFGALSAPAATTPPKPGEAWRMNLYSFRDGQADAMSWSPLLGQGNFHRSSRFGRIRFID